jgi:hypothetical protein
MLKCSSSLQGWDVGSWKFCCSVGKVAHASNPSYLGGNGRSILVWGWPQARMLDPTCKIAKVKRAGGMIQVSKCETLSSNPSTTHTPPPHSHTPTQVLLCYFVIIRVEHLSAVSEVSGRASIYPLPRWHLRLGFLQNLNSLNSVCCQHI